MQQQLHLSDGFICRQCPTTFAHLAYNPLPKTDKTNNLHLCTKLLRDLSHPSLKYSSGQKTNKRRIQPKHFPDHVSSNFVQQLTTNNTRCYIVPTAHTDQSKNSYFVTIVDWNILNELQVQAETITDVSHLSHSITCMQQPILASYNVPYSDMRFVHFNNNNDK